MTARHFDRDPPLRDLTPRSWIAMASAITATAVVLLTLLIWLGMTWFDFSYDSDGPDQGIIGALQIALGYGFVLLVINSAASLAACALLALLRARRS